MGFLSGVMVTTAVQQTRDPVCIPHSQTLHTDDGFWDLLVQLFLQILSDFITLYPVVLNHKLKASISLFWFLALLAVSFVTTVASLGAYAWSWKAAKLLNFVANFSQVISAGQVAIGLDPRNEGGRIVRQVTLPLEDQHDD